MIKKWSQNHQKLDPKNDASRLYLYVSIGYFKEYNNKIHQKYIKKCIKNGPKMTQNDQKSMYF